MGLFSAAKTLGNVGLGVGKFGYEAAKTGLNVGGLQALKFAKYPLYTIGSYYALKAFVNSGTNADLTQEQMNALAEERGTSTPTYLSNPVSVSTIGLVQGMHRGRHRG